MQSVKELPVLGAVVLSENGRDVWMATGVFERQIDTEGSAENVEPRFPLGQSLAPPRPSTDCEKSETRSDPRFTEPVLSNWVDDGAQFFSQKGLFDGTWEDGELTELSFMVRAERFRVHAASDSVAVAVGPRRLRSLIVHRIPQGVLICLCQRPNGAELVANKVASAAAKLCGKAESESS